MNRRLFGLFSGTNLTVIICAAILVPGGLYAAANYSNVAITDPNSGMMAMVDAKQRVRVMDMVASYTNNPYSVVNVSDYALNSTGYHSVLTIPDGKVFLIKSMTWSYCGNTEGTNNYLYVYDSSSKIILNFEGMHVAGSESSVLAAPIVVRSGSLTLLYSGTSGSAARIYVQGYLITADAVPPPASAEAAQQMVSSNHVADPRRPQ